MNGDMVVPPAQRREVLEIVGSALAARNDVVDFEAISRPASVDGASAVPAENGTAELGRYDPGGGADGEGSAGVGVDDDLDRSLAEESVERVRSDAGSGGEGDSGFTVRGGGLFGVDHDGHDGAGTISWSDASAEPVLGDGDESVGASLLPTPVAGFGRELVGSLVERLVDDLPFVSAQLDLHESG